MKEINIEIESNIPCQYYSDIVKGNAEELEDLRRRVTSPPWEFCCDLYDGVRDFYVFKDRKNIIGHISWIYYKNDLNRIITLDSCEAEIKFCLTTETYRGMNLYPATLIKIQNHLKQKGYKRVFICVDENNMSSIKGIEKAGFKFIKKIILIKIFGIQISKRFSFASGFKPIEHSSS